MLKGLSPFSLTKDDLKPDTPLLYLGVVETCLEHARSRECVSVLLGKHAHSLQRVVPPMCSRGPPPLFLHGRIPHCRKHRTYQASQVNAIVDKNIYRGRPHHIVCT